MVCYPLVVFNGPLFGFPRVPGLGFLGLGFPGLGFSRWGKVVVGEVVGMVVFAGVRKWVGMRRGCGGGDVEEGMDGESWRGGWGEFGGR